MSHPPAQALLHPNPRLRSPRALASILFVTLCLWMVAPGSGQKRAFDVSDLLAMERISEPQVSPDGEQVVFVLRTTDLEANRGRTDLWSTRVFGEQPSQLRLTSHEASDFHPRFAPDGQSVFFLSTRSGSAQVWRLPLQGGEAQQVTDLALDVDGFVVSPDGSSLALVLDVFADCDSLACTAERLDKADENGTGQSYESLFVRHWDTWEDGRRSHVFYLDLTKDGATPRDLMAGLDMDSPSKPFGGTEEITFTPDSRAIVFTARHGGSSEAWSTNFDLWWVSVSADPVSGGGQGAVPLTDANPAWDTQPQFSPDGRFLAWLAMRRPGYESDRFELRVASLDSNGRLSQVQTVTEGWDRSVGGYTFKPDSSGILATAGDVGKVSLFSIALGKGDSNGTGAAQNVERLFAAGTVTAALPAARGAVVLAHDDLDSPTQLYRLEAGSEQPVPLTTINDQRLAELSFGAWEQFSFAGWNGETVHGYVVQPADFDPEKKYPVAFLIHGGPQGSFGDHFHYRWNPQTYAGKGYAAVMIDFHGSTGYGQDFTDAIGKDWGGKPLEDLKKGLAAALARYPYLDGDRMCALGASYGGFMINWIAGQWQDGFQCLVNHDGVFDTRSMYYTTEELWFPEWDMGGSYFDNEEAHERFNPARFVDRWQTPMLVIQGALDYRVPPGQGLGTFTALQRRGVPSKLLFYPDENHWVLKPKNSLQWHREVEAWLARFLQ